MLLHNAVARAPVLLSARAKRSSPSVYMNTTKFVIQCADFLDYFCIKS